MLVRILIATQGKFSLPESLGPRSLEIQMSQTEDSFCFLLREWEPQIIIIDLNRFSVDFISLARKLIPDSLVGIIAYGDRLSPEKEKSCFKHGVDHLLPSFHKPWQLECRIESLLRRRELLKERLVGSNHLKRVNIEFCYFRDIELNPADHIVRVAGELTPITPIQFRLLHVFILYPEKLLTRIWLKENVWTHFKISMRSIDAQISKLKKLIPSLEDHLISVYGKGYKLSSGGEGQSLMKSLKNLSDKKQSLDLSSDC